VKNLTLGARRQQPLWSLSIIALSSFLRRRPLLRRVQHAQNCHRPRVFVADHHVIRSHDHFPGAGHTPGTVELRMLRQFRRLGLDVIFQALGGIWVVGLPDPAAVTLFLVSFFSPPDADGTAPDRDWKISSHISNITNAIIRLCTYDTARSSIYAVELIFGADRRLCQIMALPPLRAIEAGQAQLSSTHLQGPEDNNAAALAELFPDEQPLRHIGATSDHRLLNIEPGQALELVNTEVTRNTPDTVSLSRAISTTYDPGM
jgi:hypothetical protein